MRKEFISNIPNLLLHPQKYFTATVVDKSTTWKEIAVSTCILFAILTIAQSVGKASMVKDLGLIEHFVYFGAYYLSLCALILFRTYFISMILRKKNIECDSKNLMFMVSISLVFSALLSISIFLSAFPFISIFLKIMFYILSIYTLQAAIRALTHIKAALAVWIVLVMFAFEGLVKLAFIGIYN